MNPYIFTEVIEDTLCAGFEAGPAGDAPGRVRPVFARMDVPDGRYKLSVSIEATKDISEALLFANHRRLIWRGELRAGEMIGVSALCMVHPHLHGEVDGPIASRGIELALVAPGARIDSACAAAVEDMPAVLLMGDSTVTDQLALTPYAPGATYCGWGQMLQDFLNENACVGNFARSGLTLETFRTEGLYDLMKTLLRPGDIVLMQFGHNDQKRAHLQADGGYAQRLAAYIEELKLLGALPVVVTPLARNSWHNEQAYNDLLHAFAKAAKRVAAENAVPVIDLHGYMKARIERTGRDAAKVLFHIGDYTHTNDFGAYAAAGFVAGEMTRLGLVETEECDAWAPHGPYDVPANDQGDESLTPTGLEALYRSYERSDPDAPLTRMGALELVMRTCGLFALNETVALPEDVPLEEGWASDVRCALQHGLIPQDMLADGKFHRLRTISGEDFMRILALAYGMRCPAGSLPKAKDGIITRRQAAAICREAKI